MTRATPRRRRTSAEMAKVRRRREAAFKANLKARHRMTVEQYNAILIFQGGHCYLCPRTGTTKRLSVDHDHRIAERYCDHPVNESCEQCWRGLLCSTCNKVFGHARDRVEFFTRGALYLQNPPAQEWLSIERRSDDSEGARTLRSRPQPHSRRRVATTQVPVPPRQDRKRVRQPRQERVQLSRLRREGGCDQPANGSREAGLQ